MLTSLPLEPLALNTTGAIRHSAGRMAVLIEDIMDFARGRLGSGIPITTTAAHALCVVLEGVVAEVRSAPMPGERSTLMPPRRCAAIRRASHNIFANLLNNAVTHGAATEPMQIGAITHADA